MLMYGVVFQNDLIDRKSKVLVPKPPLSPLVLSTDPPRVLVLREDISAPSFPHVRRLEPGLAFERHALCSRTHVCGSHATY